MELALFDSTNDTSSIFDYERSAFLSTASIYHSDFHGYAMEFKINFETSHETNFLEFGSIPGQKKGWKFEEFLNPGL